MTTPTARDQGSAATKRALAEARAASRLPWVMSLDAVVYAVGAWTLGFWIALAFGLGWVPASLFAIAIGAGLGALHRRVPVARFDNSSEWADTVPIAVVLALVVTWPIVRELGRPALTIAVALLLALRVASPIARRSFGRVDARMLVLLATSLIATLAYWASWAMLVGALCLLVGIVVLRPRWTDWLAALTDARPAPRWATTVLLGALGVLIATWWVGVPFWNPDNAYYLNKALHFASSPITFSTGDQMFGVGGATHYPAADLLSSFEPLVASLSAVTSVSVPTLLFRLVTPLSMLAIPFAVRYAARGLGLRRANLAAALAAATIMLLSISETTLFASASTGKTIGRVVFVSILIGAVADLARRKDLSSAVKATLATVATVGLSPSLALPAGVIVAPFTAVALWDVLQSNRARTDVRTCACVSLPLAFLAGFALVAQLVQTSAGSSQSVALFSFAGPADAWEWANLSSRNRHFVPALFFIGGTALFALLPPKVAVRRGAGLVVLFLFGVLLAPWTFDAVVGDLLDLNAFAWRFVWALPTVMLVGLALAHLDLRRTLSVVSIAAFTIALGLSPLSASFLFPAIVDVRHAPATWPWDAGIPENLRDAALDVTNATPGGGRFLAPPTIEEIATAIQTDRFPTYVRVHYVQAVGEADSVPHDFFPRERLLLARAMTGQQVEAPASVWRAALTRLDIATVCLDARTAPGLRAVVMQLYVAAGSAGLCRLWTRPA